MTVKSEADYAVEFAACESENLRFTGSVQAGFSVVVIGPEAPVAATPDCAALGASTILALSTAPTVRRIGAHHDMIDAGPDGQWVRHQRGIL